MKYTVVIKAGNESGFVATVPALPGCVSQGATRKQTLRNIKEAIALYIDALFQDGLQVAKLICLIFCMGLTGCGYSATNTTDLSSFDEFQMEIFGGLQPDCPCTECPLSARIIRQSDGSFNVTFENSSRVLSADEADRLVEMFQSVETKTPPSLLLQCLARIPPLPECRINFSWSSLAGVGLFGSNYPCIAGSDTPISPSQAAEIMKFLEEIAAE